LRLLLLTVGRTKAGPERELIARYLQRAVATGRRLGFNVEHREIEESRARRPRDRKREEAKAIRALLGTAGWSIACDERGKNLATAEFAADLAHSRDQGVSLVGIIVGGPDGLDSDFCAEADLVLAFGAMTWPHQLVQIMAAEQIYRALTILGGHPYHRG
jgi:23S rRNA (pseudouridine1915-N3)-methyltransferase